MVEFGEQLRKAREEKGMTQQSLAEQLYVTRQSVSRWECGDRYPDLLTTKKISQILGVSLDDLLSGKEMKKVVERNPVIENKIVNNIMIVLYTLIIITFVAQTFEMLIRYPTQMEIEGYGQLRLVAVGLLSLIMQIACFLYGFINAVKGTLSPKRMGAVITTYFITMCISGLNAIPVGDGWQMVPSAVILVIPNLIGAIASIVYYIKGKNKKVFPILVGVASVFGIVRIIATIIGMNLFAGQYVSLYIILEWLLKMSIYVLILYQTYVLWIKRKQAEEGSKTE